MQSALSEQPSAAMTAAALPSPYVASASTEVGSYPAWKAFNDNTGGTSWWSSAFGTAAGQWLKLDMGAAKTIDGIRLHIETATGVHEFKIQGSANGTDWTDVHTGVAAVTTDAQYFWFTAAASYRYWRVLVVSGLDTNIVTVVELAYIESGTKATADTLAIIGHNLGTAAAAVSVEYSNDLTNWTEILAAFTPTTDRCIFKTFTATTARAFRVKLVTASVAPQVAVLFLGSRMTFERYPAGSLAPNPEQVVATTARGSTGNILGSVINYHLRRIRVDFRNLSPSFIADTFQPVWENYLRQLLPVFFAWEYASHPTEVYFVTVPDDFNYAPTYTPYLQDLPLEFVGIVEP
jgi:hypothetical protein